MFRAEAVDLSDVGTPLYTDQPFLAMTEFQKPTGALHLRSRWTSYQHALARDRLLRVAPADDRP